ncbi:hypothetical protein [Paraglaciecola hydrolytica]|uniref:MSHA biogenesis protein MshK n=1 Tax=Paraglaciecola hydrolytica TaxID=1799789 RepID=A0A136A4D5_9ALTE|nr:hypothetical protein [Paraglaciecola hydrolytica]KXI30102.1 hypothetical protein AX660_08880 [Paraglaciecola hydrolytica]
MTYYRYLLLLLLLSAPLSVQGKTDPTRPQNYTKNMLSEEQNNELSLSAIFVTGNTKQAIINGLSYGEGQSVYAYKVVSISANKVELSGPQGKQLLFINNNNVKKDAKNGF